MLRLIETPTWSTEIGRDEYVRLTVDGNQAMFLRTDEDDIYLVMDDILTGCRPNLEYREEIERIMGWDDTVGWRFPFSSSRRTLESLMNWFIDDCRDFGHITLDDIVLIGGSGPILVDSLVERKEFILKDYTSNLYSGMHSYHHSHGVTMNTPIKEMKPNAYRIGVELEIEATSSSNRDKINKIRTNWFFQESDSSLGRNGIELVTIPLLPKDAMSVDTWAPLVDYLKPLASSYDCSSCGLHIHIGREALGKDETEKQATLGKLLFLYYEHLKPMEWNTKIYGRRSTYNEQHFDCKESNAVKVLGMDLMSDKKIRDKVDKGLKETAERTRYYDINVQNANTIEFRKGKGSICTERIIAIITYCDLMIRYCRKRDWMGMSASDFLEYVRKNAAKSSPIFRYLPTMGEEA